MVKISEMAATNEVLANELEDPEFAEEWDRTAFARAVAERVLAYRTEQGLTQTPARSPSRHRCQPCSH